MKKNRARRAGRCGLIGLFVVLGVVCMFVGLVQEVVWPEFDKLFADDLLGRILSVVLFPPFLVLFVIAFFIVAGSIFGGSGPPPPWV